MKVDQLTTLLMYESIRRIKAPGEELEILQDTKTYFKQLEYQTSMTGGELEFAKLIRILGTPFSVEKGESFWDTLVSEDGFKRPCLLVFVHDKNELEFWARNYNTAMNARSIISYLYKNPEIDPETGEDYRDSLPTEFKPLNKRIDLD